MSLCHYYHHDRVVASIVFRFRLDIGSELEALFQQLRGKESQLRIILNKADSISEQQLMRVYGALFWSLAPLINVTEPPRIYVGSFWSEQFKSKANEDLFLSEEMSLLHDMSEVIKNRIGNKIAFLRQHAIRVRIHSLLVDSYVAAYRRNSGMFGGGDEVAQEIVENPRKYFVYKTILAHPNVSEYDLPEPSDYHEFFQIHPLGDLKRISDFCTYMSGCAMEKLDAAISVDLPRILRKFQEANGFEDEFAEDKQACRGGKCGAKEKQIEAESSSAEGGKKVNKYRKKPKAELVEEVEEVAEPSSSSKILADARSVQQTETKKPKKEASKPGKPAEAKTSEEPEEIATHKYRKTIKISHKPAAESAESGDFLKSLLTKLQQLFDTGDNMPTGKSYRKAPSEASEKKAKATQTTKEEKKSDHKPLEEKPGKKYRKEPKPTDSQPKPTTTDQPSGDAKGLWSYLFSLIQLEGSEGHEHKNYRKTAASERKPKKSDKPEVVEEKDDKPTDNRSPKEKYRKSPRVDEPTTKPVESAKTSAEPELTPKQKYRKSDARPVHKAPEPKEEPPASSEPQLTPKEKYRKSEVKPVVKVAEVEEKATTPEKSPKDKYRKSEPKSVPKTPEKSAEVQSTKEDKSPKEKYRKNEAKVEEKEVKVEKRSIPEPPKPSPKPAEKPKKEAKPQNDKKEADEEEVVLTPKQRYRKTEVRPGHKAVDASEPESNVKSTPELTPKQRYRKTEVRPTYKQPEAAKVESEAKEPEEPQLTPKQRYRKSEARPDHKKPEEKPEVKDSSPVISGKEKYRKKSKPEPATEEEKPKTSKPQTPKVPPAEPTKPKVKEEKPKTPVKLTVKAESHEKEEKEVKEEKKEKEIKETKEKQEIKTEAKPEAKEPQEEERSTETSAETASSAEETEVTETDKSDEKSAEILSVPEEKPLKLELPKSVTPEGEKPQGAMRYRKNVSDKKPTSGDLPSGANLLSVLSNLVFGNGENPTPSISRGQLGCNPWHRSCRESNGLPSLGKKKEEPKEVKKPCRPRPKPTETPAVQPGKKYRKKSESVEES